MKKVFQKFSVLMSVYKNDNPSHFRQAVLSVINQTVPPAEIIIVIDGPVGDELKNEIDSVAKEYPIIKLVPLEINMGLGLALREGAKHCSYDLIARMDSDDISLPDRFEKQLKHFEADEELGVVGGNMSEFVGDPGNIVSIRKLPEYHAEICKFLKKRSPLNHVTVMMKKSCLEKAGGYLDWRYMEDYFLWIRMYLAGVKFYNIQDNLVNVRIDDLFKRRAGFRYFKNLANLQKFMLKNKVISFPRYLINVFIRFVQFISPNWLKKLVYKSVLREKAT